VHTILLVEDSVDVFNLVKRALGSSIHLEWAKNLAEASKTLQRKTFDLILLDVMLPDGDGFRLCSLLQTDDQLKNSPVIFLTAKTSISDKVLGFSVGAEDFITKPFDPLELKARIESRLRKRDREKMEADILKIGDIEVNKSTQKVHISDNGQTTELDLTPIEFKLLLLLCQETNKVYSRDEVLNTVWGEQVHVFARSVDTHISKLRKKLGSKSGYIESVHGTGYRFAVNDASPDLKTDLSPLPLQHSLL
jgi:two-component system alkaline phosphatase synthesis response regulator PhoP